MAKSMQEMQNRLKYSYQDNSAANAKMTLFTKKFNGHQSQTKTEIASLTEALDVCK